jgi:cysteinyl-tRNA synthetase
MNITDVDDKTIRDSIKAQETLENFTKKYTKLFLDDINKLGIEKADNIVPVTSLIPEMRRMIQTMLNRKNAYLSEDSSIYFKVSSFKNY